MNLIPARHWNFYSTDWIFSLTGSDNHQRFTFHGNQSLFFQGFQYATHHFLRASCRATDVLMRDFDRHPIRFSALVWQRTGNGPVTFRNARSPTEKWLVAMRYSLALLRDRR